MVYNIKCLRSWSDWFCSCERVILCSFAKGCARDIPQLLTVRGYACFFASIQLQRGVVSKNLIDSNWMRYSTSCKFKSEPCSCPQYSSFVLPSGGCKVFVSLFLSFYCFVFFCWFFFFLILNRDKLNKYSTIRFQLLGAISNACKY